MLKMRRGGKALLKMQVNFLLTLAFQIQPRSYQLLTSVDLQKEAEDSNTSTIIGSCFCGIFAGSVFLGQWTPESVGDYASGTNAMDP